jgi:class 3 adenylate cyclase
MVSSFTAPAVHTELALLISFVDLSRFRVDSERLTDRELAALVDELYTRVSARIVGAGGAVVKFMGDAALIVFPESLVNEGVLALLELQEETDAWLRERGWDSRLIVKAHFGTAVAGPFGPRADRRHDVIGGAVNLAATLPTRSFALSAQAFRKLSPEVRRRFMKHTPPITYIPVGSQRPR